jgi:hypothetical protein
MAAGLETPAVGKNNAQRHPKKDRKNRPLPSKRCLGAVIVTSDVASITHKFESALQNKPKKTSEIILK